MGVIPGLGAGGGTARPPSPLLLPGSAQPSRGTNESIVGRAGAGDGCGGRGCGHSPGPQFERAPPQMSDALMLNTGNGGQSTAPAHSLSDEFCISCL